LGTGLEAGLGAAAQCSDSRLVLLLAPVAFLVAAGLGYALRPLALRLGLVDRPAAHKAHSRPTPYLGGLAIAGGTLLAGWALPRCGGPAPALAAGAAAMALLGLADDVRPLRPLPKLAGTCAVAAAVVLAAGPVTIVGHALDPVLAVAWIVVLTNSFNLLDNSDGAAAAVGCVTAGLLAVIAHAAGRPATALLLAALSAACLGFLLPHNRAPARMFMGDAGSLFVGFVICAGAVLTAGSVGHGGPGMTGVAVLVMITFVAAVDTALVVVSRRRAGRSWLAGGTDHIAHRLRRLGWGVNGAALTLAGCAAVSCLAALGVAWRLLPAAAVLAAAVALAAAAIGLLLRVEVYAPATGVLTVAPAPGPAPGPALGTAAGPGRATRGWRFGPVAASAFEPVVVPAAEPAHGSARGPAREPAAGSVAGPARGPAYEPAAAPGPGPARGSAAGPVPGVVFGPGSEPVRGVVLGPVAGPAGRAVPYAAEGQSSSTAAERQRLRASKTYRPYRSTKA